MLALKIDPDLEHEGVVSRGSAVYSAQPSGAAYADDAARFTKRLRGTELRLNVLALKVLRLRWDRVQYRED